MKLKINLPEFDGFYNSIFEDLFEISNDLENSGDVTAEQYENINWSEVHKLTAEDYLSNFVHYYRSDLLKFGINFIYFEGLESPKYYNYSTDKINCVVDFNVKVFKVTVLDFINDNRKEFEQFVKDNYSSYSGFISFYSNDVAVWEQQYIKKVNKDNCIFEGFLLFIMQHALQYDKDYINSMTIENKHNFLTFNKLAA